MLPGLDPLETLAFWTVAALLWPFLFVGGFLFVFRAPIRKRLAFVVLGVLMYFGIQLVVVTLGPAARIPSSVTGAQVIRIMLDSLFKTNLITSIAVLGPLWWLGGILRHRHQNV